MKPFYKERSLEDLKKIALNYKARFEWQRKDTRSYGYDMKVNFEDGTLMISFVKYY